MSDSTYKKVKEYLVQKGYHAVPDETYDHIDEWLEWYQNDVEKFHHYKLYNGAVMTNQERYKLGMAKTVCEDWANLLLNEKVSIKAGKYSEQLSKILRYNNFSKQGNQLIEKAFALGTGAFVEYKDANDRVIIDYIRADMIYPLSWDNGDVTECAFGTSRMLDGKEVIYLQLHRFGKTEDGENDEQYYIENVYIDAKSGKETDTPEDIEELVSTGSTEPLFQIVAPNICNNIDLDSPLGISVYANGIDEVKGCDLTYDSYMNEFVLGRKRIMVPISQARVQMEKDGTVSPTFDPKLDTGITLEELPAEGGIYAELGDGFEESTSYNKQEVKVIPVLFLCRHPDQKRCLEQLCEISGYLQGLKQYPQGKTFAWLNTEIAKEPSKIGRDEDGVYHYSCILNCKIYC